MPQKLNLRRDLGRTAHSCMKLKKVTAGAERSVEHGGGFTFVLVMRGLWFTGFKGFVELRVYRVEGFVKFRVEGF